jgi:sortase A
MLAHTEQRGRRGTCLAWLERLLVLAGAALLIASAIVVADAVLAQRVARRSLDSATIGAGLMPPRVGEVPVDAAPSPVSKVDTLDTGAAVASLSIPRLKMSSVVLHGADKRTLRRGPGHLEHTALPGQPGNMVIAGHRDTFFRPLQGIRVGDDIFVESPEGQFHYRVTWLRVVDPHEVSVLEPTGGTTLTLITCYPFSILGSAPDRFIVRAEAVRDQSDAASSPRPAGASQSPWVPPIEGTHARETEPPAGRMPAARDDERLVRAAVERFRLAYNARVTVGDIAAGGPLEFDACEVVVADDRAVALCQTRGEAAFELQRPRAFTFAHGPQGWAIKSISLE